MVHHLVGRPIHEIHIPSPASQALGFYGSAEVPLEEPTFEHVPDALDVIDGPRGLFIFNSWMSLAGHSEYHEKNVAKKTGETWQETWPGSGKVFFTNLNMNLSFLGYTATPLGKHIVEIIWVAWGLWNQELHCNKFTNHKNYGNYGIPSFVDPWFMDPSNCFLHPSGQEILYHLGLKMGVDPQKAIPIGKIMSHWM